MSNTNKTGDDFSDDILKRNSAEAGMIMVKRAGEKEFRPIQEVADEEAEGRKKLAEAMHGSSSPKPAESEQA